ncbi:uncharacterized protein LOC132273181 [Cornus florida]|uniref:uncharacterized protein LOC132273181 n=1 Tax=Cornus florida TaxID=4283 RepID=UPI00289EB33A|nr:uncharacterized protein LOC132273181 [Cornus florida]
MKLNPSKCSFAVSSGQFLGHIVNKRGIEVSPTQAKALMQNQELKTRREVQVLTGQIAALSRFISRLLDKCKPFFDAIKSKNKDIWGPQQQVALNQLKQYMAKPPIISVPKSGEVLIMYLAISSIATSAVLIREEGKNQYPVFYTSKTMTDVETRISKWAIELSSFDITYEPKVSHKGQALVDFLLEYKDTPEGPELPKPHWELQVDGSSNQTSAGVRVVISTPEDTKLQQSICLNFPVTNNEAKYEALLTGLRLASRLQVRCLKVFSDSQLLVNQVTGQYRPKEEMMKAYKEAVENVTRGFDQIEFNQVPRVENAEADQLATVTSSSNKDLTRIILIDILDEPSNNSRQEKVIFRPLLEMFKPTEALVVLKQIHDGDCGNHSGGRSLAHKVLTQSYFWPYLARNAEEYARRCDKCQRHGPMKHQPAEDLHVMANLWPFAQWGIDMVGPLPKTVEQKEYALLATDYFTKWVEAKAYSSVTHKQVKSFLWKSIICQFGVPKVIMMDNGTNLDNKSTRKLFTEHGIVQKLATVSHPQGNGQAEITNRTIFSCLKKKLEKLKTKWYKNLPQLKHSLDLLDEKRDAAAIRLASYQQQLRRSDNKRVRFRSFVQSLCNIKSSQEYSFEAKLRHYSLKDMVISF